MGDAPYFMEEHQGILCWVMLMVNGFNLKYWHISYDPYDYGLAAIVSDY